MLEPDRESFRIGLIHGTAGPQDRGPVEALEPLTKHWAVALFAKPPRYVNDALGIDVPIGRQYIAPEPLLMQALSHLSEGVRPNIRCGNDALAL